MQEEISLHFVTINFLSCYHIDDKFYKWSSTEAIFQEGIQLNKLMSFYPEERSVMQLLQWNGPIQKQDDQTEIVLMQILKITPLIFEEGQQKPAILHEMAIVTWSCEAVELGLWFTKIFKLRRLHHKRIFVVLSKVIDEDWMHCFKNGHLGCLLSKDKWEKMLKNSVYLEKNLQEMLEYDVVVKIGITEQKAVANCELISKANRLRSLVYDQIDVSYVTLEDISAGGTIINPRLISTQNLEQVFQFSNEEDTFLDC
jgi:hypothetical protein